ncbi:single-stranded-DNA-specific exonuclease [Caloramator fervidus]|uniref:Single-stranded-DNA-specific exonuclease RecJ n=1 Tax=Caloramator fervidus TaxID=29344 RepID=A0A1H5W0C8_9CLOT|nr:single-stranded-DNA-specific exonuclease RecJ [Caloramator fervidus]SEF92581.1 single-stranded-DNA-specific exonuclease [Caloramator fervidus]
MKRWKIKDRSCDIFVHENSLINALLISRGITTKEKVNAFLNPSLEQLYDPLLLKDMDKAVKRIDEAIKKREKIYIYGDYDVDGITSTAILYRAFKRLGVDVSFYIPDRVNEGYGINKDAIDHIHSLAVDLIITVDSGITAVEEIEYAKSLGLDVIVTDHHECKSIIPNTIAINPKRHDCSYPFKGLAGCGVAFKLVQALFNYYNIKGYEEFLDLVAIGTIADIVDIVDENRILVKYGLDMILNSDKVGIKAIKQIAGIKDTISTYNVAFQIAPRLNAAGRLSDAKIAVELFITNDEEKALQIAKYLDLENRKRQKIEQDILQECMDMISNEVDLKHDRVIVLSSPNWHVGVVGIVASRIVEKFRRPTILFCEEGEFLRGSGRSIEGFNLFENLVACSNLLEKFGGHELAAGMTLKKGNLVEFKNKLNALAKMVDSKYFTECIDIDLEVDPQEVTIQTAEILNLFEPYGVGNKEPTFVLKNARVISKKPIGSQGQFIKFMVEKDNKVFECIDFTKDNDFLNKDWEYVDIAFNFNINEWNGTKILQLNVKDIKPVIDHNLGNFRKNYFKYLKDVICINNIKSFNLSNVKFIKKDIDFLREFIHFKKGIILFNDINSLDELKIYADFLEFSLYKAFCDAQFVLFPKVKDMNLEKKYILIYDYLLNVDDYVYLDNKNATVFHFVDGNLIKRLKNFKEYVVFNENKTIKFIEELRYNEIIGTLNDIAERFEFNVFMLYRLLIHLKKKGIINIYKNGNVIKIILLNEYKTIEDDLENNFNSIINFLENKTREV